MKKQYFLMAMAATMFAACSQTEVIDEVVDNSTPKAIGFTTYTEGQTRAENSGKDYADGLEEHHKNFKVWAYKDVSETKVFDNQLVTWNTNSWYYTPLRYWDKAATSYEFYAAAPAYRQDGSTAIDWKLNKNADADHTDDFFTLSEFELFGVNLSTNTYDSRQNSWENSPTDIDLMIASPNQVGRAGFTSTPVNLQFNHILSRLNVTLYKANILEDKNVVLKSIIIKGLKSKGSFNENADLGSDNLIGGTTKRWETESNTCDIKLVDDYIVEENTGIKNYVIQSLVIPQTSTLESLDLNGTGSKTQPYFIITYKIGDEEFVAHYNLSKAFGVSPLAFNEGWENTLNITIQPTAITFDAEVAEWDEKHNKDLTIE